MTSFAFTKMHGLGNDFVVINANKVNTPITPAMVRRMSDRHTGIGCDQVLILGNGAAADTFKYTIYNSDGSSAEHCGNGARCIARYVKENGLSTAKAVTFQMASRAIHTHYHDDDQISVDMGAVSFDPEFEVIFKHETFTIMPVMLSNPHAITIAPLDGDQLIAMGEILNHHPRFPAGVNFSAIRIIDKHHIQLDVYERGAGITQACGSAACAAAALGIKRGLLASPCTVTMPGGDCEIICTHENGPVILKGPAVRVFDGVWHDQQP